MRNALELLSLARDDARAEFKRELARQARKLKRDPDCGYSWPVHPDEFDKRTQLRFMRAEYLDHALDIANGVGRSRIVHTIIGCDAYSADYSRIKAGKIFRSTK